jgi:hypothetical protein
LLPPDLGLFSVLIRARKSKNNRPHFDFREIVAPRRSLDFLLVFGVAEYFLITEEGEERREKRAKRAKRERRERRERRDRRERREKREKREERREKRERR